MSCGSRDDDRLQTASPLMLSVFAPPILLGSVAGLIVGLVGAGGTVMSVPMLVYALGMRAKLALAVSLGGVALSSSIGAIVHRKAGNLDMKTALVFGGSGIVGSFTGARFAKLIPGPVQLLLFGLVTGIVALVMFSGAGRHNTADTDESPPVARSMGVGLICGLVTGIFGLGGGVVTVPTLTLVMGLSMHRGGGHVAGDHNHDRRRRILGLCDVRQFR